MNRALLLFVCTLIRRNQMMMNHQHPSIAPVETELVRHSSLQTLYNNVVLLYALMWICYGFKCVYIGVVNCRLYAAVVPQCLFYFIVSFANGAEYMRWWAAIRGVLIHGRADRIMMDGKESRWYRTRMINNTPSDNWIMTWFVYSYEFDRYISSKSVFRIVCLNKQLNYSCFHW